MTQNITAEIISIGTEILLGELTDTNSVYLARQLRNLGLNIYFMTSVGDNENRIVSSLEVAMSRADVIITCGGLGPTVDDMTRQAVAKATNRSLIFHQDLYESIAERFAMYQMTMPENNRRQAYLPDDAQVIVNPVGTAPAFIVQHKGKTIITLPGVPREMKFLMQESVIPYLLKVYQLGTIQTRILKSAGIGESALDEILGDDLLNLSNPTIGLAAHHGVIDIRLTAKAHSSEDAQRMLNKLAQSVYDRAGRFIFGENDDQLADVFCDYLEARSLTCHVVEIGVRPDESIATTLRASSQLTFEIKPFPSELRENPRSIQDYAHQILKTLIEDGRSDALATVVTNPDVDEDADDAINTVIILWSGGVTKKRVYGFGGKSPLLRDWLSRWTIATIWQMFREQRESMSDDLA